MPRFFIPVATGLAWLAIAATTPARADFFTLDGRFECLERANSVCGDARMLPPAAGPQASRAPVAIEAPAPAPPAAPAALPNTAAPTPTAASDPLRAIALRIATRQIASGDLAALKEAAQRGNASAMELLAWCALNAIGERRDPIEAYLLYGVAASAALPRARENQAAIYERGLDSHQRQLVLDLANEGVAAAQPP